MLLCSQYFREMEFNKTEDSSSGIFSGDWAWFLLHFSSLSRREEIESFLIVKNRRLPSSGFQIQKKVFEKWGLIIQRQWMRIEPKWKSSVYSKEMIQQWLSSHVYNFICYNTRTSPFLDSINKPYLLFYFASPALSQHLPSAFGIFWWRHNFFIEEIWSTTSIFKRWKRNIKNNKFDILASQTHQYKLFRAPCAKMSHWRSGKKNKKKKGNFCLTLRTKPCQT